MAGATEFVVEAAKNLIEDPVETLKNAGEDVINVPGYVVDAIRDVFDGEDEPDDHAVTNDDWGGPRAPLKPGQTRID